MLECESLTVNKVLFLCLVSLFLSACAAGPDFMRPDTAATGQQAFVNQPASASNPSVMGLWWKKIDDPYIGGHVDRLLTQNLDIRQASARIAQARARLGVQRGAYFPSVSGNSSASRSFTAFPIPSLPSGSERIFANNYDAGLSASWEVDLFGRIRRSTEAARAQFDATIYDQDALVHSLISELVRRRIAISVQNRLLQLARDNSANREKILTLVRNRYERGVNTTRVEDFLLAQENFTTVNADVYQFQRRLSDELYAFDVLLGQAPGTTNPSDLSFPLLPAPLDSPVCVPASLLDRRPDLRASELRLKAANAEIGVAIADLYPNLTLSGSIGFSGDSTNDLFTADQLAGSLASSLLLRIFEGGALRANIDLQRAEAEELTYAYAGTVLNAMREVETALVFERELAQEVTVLRQSVASIKKAESVSEERYRKGLLSLREFLDTQQRLYQIEQTAILREQQKWDNRISLYLALGGDWFSQDQEEEMCQ